LVKDIIALCPEKVSKIGFVIGDFGKDVEQTLLDIARSCGAEGSIYYQEKALGTAHAILCAGKLLEGKTVVAFADTLFKTDYKIDTQKDGVIFVQKVKDPKAFGVVKMDETGRITDFVEKPQTFVSDLAIIGVYYFKDGSFLRDEMQYLIDHNITEKGEYQLTNAMENMKNKGADFYPGEMQEWLDCGNKDATVYTNQRILEFNRSVAQSRSSLNNVNSIIIEPCFIGENVTLENAVIGPHVSLGDHVKVVHSIIKNSIIQKGSQVKNKLIADSMIGSHVILKGNPENLSIGDYTTHEQ
jgi:glucose-1-phosphate thymidylyltransferase